MADKGTLRALVFDGPSGRVYLGHDGAPVELELEAIVSVGGEWEEAQVYHEDGPPDPPGRGLWLMELDWHRVTEQERRERLDGEELCCIYDGRPRWTRIPLPIEPREDSARLASGGES
jgi:hypothetical protein